MATQSTTAPVTLDNLLLASKVPETYPHLFNDPQWRWARTNRANNGLSRAFRHIGNKLYVNTLVLAECIEAQQEGAA